MNTGPTSEVEALVQARDSWHCVVCGQPIRGQQGWDWSIHHRQNRGSGGTSDPAINYTSNLLTVCGNGTTGCHGRIESYRTDAKSRGWIVPRPLIPAHEPVYITGPNHVDGAWLYLTDDQRYSNTEPTAEVTS